MVERGLGADDFVADLRDALRELAQNIIVPSGSDAAPLDGLPPFLQVAAMVLGALLLLIILSRAVDFARQRTYIQACRATIGKIKDGWEDHAAVPDAAPAPVPGGEAAAAGPPPPDAPLSAPEEGGFALADASSLPEGGGEPEPDAPDGGSHPAELAPPPPPPDPSLPSLSRAELIALLDRCMRLGRRIDRHTNRRNNSRRVAPLVYQLGEALEVPLRLRALYFCSALVYDAGYLDLGSELFRGEILSAKERRWLQTHVMLAESYVDFVPRSVYPLFFQAIFSHHENYDGSGYPEGLRGAAIPRVARLIRVAESYVALVSRRSYHHALKKAAAFKVLRAEEAKYEPSLLDVLATLV